MDGWMDGRGWDGMGCEGNDFWFGDLGSSGISIQRWTSKQVKTLGFVVQSFRSGRAPDLMPFGAVRNPFHELLYLHIVNTDRMLRKK